MFFNFISLIFCNFIGLIIALNHTDQVLLSRYVLLLYYLQILPIFNFTKFFSNFSARGFDQLNVYGEPLEVCSLNPITGWFRDGFARTDENDFGSHTVCATMTEEVRNILILGTLYTQFGIHRIFLSLRFYVKSKYANPETQNPPS